MRTLCRRRVIVPAAAAAVVVAVVMGAAWSLLSDERRMGSFVERQLVRRTGLPITVHGASWNGRRLLLRDVHLAAGPALPVDVRVSELAIHAGILMVIAPAGRTAAVTATGASITLAGSSMAGWGGVEALRSRLLLLLGWPGEVTLRAPIAELRTSRTDAIALDLEAAKQGPGLALALALRAPSSGETLQLKVRGAAALGRALDLVVDVSGSPRAIAAVWPGAVSLTPSVSARVQLQLLAGGVVSSFGRLSVETSAGDRVGLDVTARYDSSTGDVGVSRYSVAWADDIRLSGTARLTREAAGRRLRATARGHAARTAVDATATYDPESGAFEIDVRLSGPDASRVARRLGLQEPRETTARDVRARTSGRIAVTTLAVRVDARTSHATTAP